MVFWHLVLLGNPLDPCTWVCKSNVNCCNWSTRPDTSFWRRVLGCHVTMGYMLMVSPPEKKTTQPKLSLGSRKQWSIVFFLYQYQDVFVPYNMVCKLQHNNDEITCHSKVPALKLNLGVCCRFLGPSFTSNTFVPTTTLEDTRTAAASYPSTTNGPTLAASKAGAKMKTWFY